MDSNTSQTGGVRMRWLSRVRTELVTHPRKKQPKTTLWNYSSPGGLSGPRNAKRKWLVTLSTDGHVQMKESPLKVFLNRQLKRRQIPHKRSHECPRLMDVMALILYAHTHTHTHTYIHTTHTHTPYINIHTCTPYTHTYTTYIYIHTPHTYRCI